ncbi:magnesium transporter MgtC [Enterococcus ureilyticus]|uniref:Magnesium transporter MgtC n=1 Tax=Enterococcus ureilyticus TaxID=1131292 RepID=A0A1E5HF90_9ENTE|nr:MgtC/SapB family protein [Enterococcus ureilyticus]MBM7689350.1 putative Mg2+ transporter-C (MgtC) family protein [Enterococcus ureilyticus]MBO0446596.1 MgtC/SapB family protein [Enterococcus ureilyticus]OEG23617.1 magnesium transporter MgtC [Enterococcus ureilyticus]
MVDIILTVPEIIIRLCLAMLIGGVIGFERQYKNRPAGMRTHILVCMGATIIALIQVEIAASALQDAINHPELTGVIRSDQARLIAQVVSGIGFLGAGTIIVTKQSVTGLTTAASLWAVAGLGIAIGMGYYAIAITSFIGVFIALTVVRKVIHVPTTKKLEIRYIHKQETKEFINQYFEEHKIEIEDVNFNVVLVEDVQIYTNIYTIDLPKGMTYAEVIEDLSIYKNITKLRLVSI